MNEDQMKDRIDMVINDYLKFGLSFGFVTGGLGTIFFNDMRFLFLGTAVIATAYYFGKTTRYMEQKTEEGK